MDHYHRDCHQTNSWTAINKIIDRKFFDRYEQDYRQEKFLDHDKKNMDEKSLDGYKQNYWEKIAIRKVLKLLLVRLLDRWIFLRLLRIIIEIANYLYPYLVYYLCIRIYHKRKRLKETVCCIGTYFTTQWTFRPR